jgi:hypothetical protein
MFTVVIEYTHPEDGLQEQDSWVEATLDEAKAAIEAARNLDCYINPIGFIYDADGNQIRSN